jgi:Domain of unknown function (DUF4338)
MSTIRIQGRDLNEADIEQIRQLRRDHPEWSRQQLSIALAEQWQWHNAAGRLKDMAARTLLLKLRGRGLIDLPAPLHQAARKSACRAPEAPHQLSLLDLSPIEGPLRSLEPITLELVDNRGQRRRLTELLQQHHYRGYNGAVGENVQYLARDAQVREIAVMVFGAAAWKVTVRDRFIGWSPRERTERLFLVANQQRFLILPWVRVVHLASHLLALAIRRLSEDWQARYAHPIHLVESFVEIDRFAGASYKAAGWVCLGQTTGRTRQDPHHHIQTPLKTVWVRSLHPQWRERLRQP